MYKRQVNGHAPFPGLKDGTEVVFKGVPAKSNIIKPCTDDTSDDAAQCDVDKFIGDDAELFALGHGENHRQKDAQGNQDAVPDVYKRQTSLFWRPGWFG